MFKVTRIVTVWSEDRDGQGGHKPWTGGGWFLLPLEPMALATNLWKHRPHQSWHQSWHLHLICNTKWLCRPTREREIMARRGDVAPRHSPTFNVALIGGNGAAFGSHHAPKRRVVVTGRFGLIWCMMASLLSSPWHSRILGRSVEDPFTTPYPPTHSYIQSKTSILLINWFFAF